MPELHTKIMAAIKRKNEQDSDDRVAYNKLYSLIDSGNHSMEARPITWKDLDANVNSGTLIAYGNAIADVQVKLGQVIIQPKTGGAPCTVPVANWDKVGDAIAEVLADPIRHRR